MLFGTAFGADCAIASYPVPISRNTVSLKWAVRFGTSYRDAPSVPAVSGDCLAVMNGKKLLKVNKSDGGVIEEAEMSYSPALGYVPPTINGDMVYCPIYNATVEAFDFNSMKKLWTYSDELGGQALTNIIYSGGLVFTGFWNDEDETASYVCLDALTGSLKWRIEHKGGFYRADCAVIGDYAVFGGDDGTVYDDRTSCIYSVEISSGRIKDKAELNGDIRSGVSYCEENGRAYAVSKSGYIYSLSFKNGVFGEIKKAYLGGASTSTPAIYGGRVYVGVQTGALKGNISVLDRDTLGIIYTAETLGYPQSELLLSDFYSGGVQIYTTYNALPGGVMVMTDSEGQTEPDIDVLFTPEKNQSGYSISAIMTDNGGTLYYKNDSGYIFALENSVNTDKMRTFFEKLYSMLLTTLELLNKIFS